MPYQSMELRKDILTIPKMVLSSLGLSIRVRLQAYVVMIVGLHKVRLQLQILKVIRNRLSTLVVLHVVPFNGRVILPVHLNGMDRMNSYSY